MTNPNRRPTFLFIGTAKSGSTWVYDAMRGHPDVFIPVAKDLQFFDYHYHLGLDWYLRHFENAGSALALGELSHDYYQSKDAARRIRMDLPGCKLICCLREPGAFAVSTLLWWHSHTTRFGLTFAEMAEDPRFTHLLSYRQNLEFYFDLFPREQILVAYYEHLKADPWRFVSELYEFIGVDPSFRPAALGSRSNVTRPPRNRMLMHSAVAAAQMLRRMGAANLVGAIKQNPLFGKIAYSSDAPSQHPSVKSELDRIAAIVRRRAADEIEPLSRLVGKPIPTEWLSVESGQ